MPSVFQLRYIAIGSPTADKLLTLMPRSQPTLSRIFKLCLKFVFQKESERDKHFSLFFLTVVKGDKQRAGGYSYQFSQGPPFPWDRLGSRRPVSKDLAEMRLPNLSYLVTSKPFSKKNDPEERIKSR